MFVSIYYVPGVIPSTFYQLTYLIVILELRKLRHWEGKQLFQGNTAP